MRHRLQHPTALARRRGVVALAVMLVLTACSGEPGPPAQPAASQTLPPEPTPTRPAPPSTTAPAGGVATPTAPPPPRASASPVATEVTEIVNGLDTPWGVAFTPDERIFITEEDSGRLLELADGEVSEVQRFAVDPAGEGGLLGLAVAPDYADSGLLYAYMSTAEDNRVVRFVPGSDPEPVLTGIPHGSIHNGGRIAFGPDGLLYIGTGDAGQAEQAQDRSSLGGKILRLSPDGDVPEDNPENSPVYSFGHRNVQGLAWDGEGRLYASELGPDRDDEINRIEPGGNYGWPEVTGTADVDGLIDPLLVRQPSEASWSGIALSPDAAVPQWAGDLLVASLRGQRLWHLSLADDGTITEAEALLVQEYGRLRTVVFAPDGSLWVVTSNTDRYGSPRPGDDRIIRLAPER